MKLAREEGMIISIDMASYNVVESNNSFLHDIVENYVDIVFANETEAFSYTGKGRKMPCMPLHKRVTLPSSSWAKKGLWYGRITRLII